MFPNVSTATKRSNLCYFVITIGYGSHLKTLFITYTINALSFLYIMSFQNINNIDVFLYNVTQCAFAICSRLRTIWFGQKRGPGSGNNTRGFLKLCLPTKGQKGRKKTSLEEGGRTKWSAINLQNSAKNTVSQKSSMASWQYHVTYSILIHPMLF